MDDEAIRDHFKPLYADLLEKEELFRTEKPLLAHYTNIHALEKILETDELWFSNPLFMNDLEEVRFGILQGVPLVLSNNDIVSACKSPERANIFKQHFNSYYNEFANEHALDTYVFCMSEHMETDKDGLLSMWRGYGGNGIGAAIVIDTAQISKSPGSPLIMSEVIYASGEERIDWLKKALFIFATLLQAADIPDDKLYIAAFHLFQRIKLFTLFTKHNGFHEEKEWRIVYLKDRDRNNIFEHMFGYWVGPRGIEPKLKLKVAPIEGLTEHDLSLSKIINQIILGPSISSPLAKATIERMLDQLDKSELKAKVHSSTIPFRSTTY